MSCPVDELVHKRHEGALEELEEAPLREEVSLREECPRHADAEGLILGLRIGKMS